jgi:hydroxymethylpyrimidine pyrophosphatase-like HAD family hydrolase
VGTISSSAISTARSRSVDGARPALVAAFRRAAARGLAITIATGRMPRSVDFYREELEIRLPLIYYNGGLIRDAAGTELLRRELPRGILAKVRASLLGRARARDLLP